MIYTFTSIVANATIDFLRFTRNIWQTTDPDLARRAREHPLCGKEFFDATPEVPIPVSPKQKQNQNKNLNRLKKSSIKKLKELCIINGINPDGKKEVLIERLDNLKEIHWTLKRSEAPILQLSEIAYQKRQRMKRHKTKKIGK